MFSVKDHILDPPLIGRYIKVIPKTWNNAICNRMELFGCSGRFDEHSYPREAKRGKCNERDVLNTVKCSCLLKKAKHRHNSSPSL